MNRASMSCGATSGGLIPGLLKSPKQKREKNILKNS